MRTAALAGADVAGVRAVLNYARNGVEPLLVLFVLAVLHRFDLTGHTPFWLVAALLLAGSAVQQPRVQLRLAGGDYARRLFPRLALHMGLTAALMYCVGWGPLLAVAQFHILSMHLAWSGSKAWRPATVAAVGAIGLGQLAVALGLYSYLPAPEVHGAAALVAIGVATTCRVLGVSAAERERAEATLRAREEQFRVLVQDSSDVIGIVDGSSELIYVSPSSARVFGLAPDRLVGRQLWQRIHPDDVPAAVELHGRVLASTAGEERGEFRIRNGGGQWRWLEVSSRNLLADPAVHGVVGHYRDVTERRAAQDEVAYAATHDGLTGLVNAQTFTLELEHALAAGGDVGLLFLDLDGFKAINDTHGHETGDGLLGLVAGLIRRHVGPADVVGRLGGDEFGVVLARAADAPPIVARLEEAIDRDLEVLGRTVRVGCSIGVAVPGPPPVQAKALLREADLAMYERKRGRLSQRR